jgi:hypothetical protein
MMGERSRPQSLADTQYHELLTTPPPPPQQEHPTATAIAAAAAMATATTNAGLPITLGELKNMSRARFVAVVLVSVLLLIVLALANLGAILKDHNIFEKLAAKMLAPKADNSTAEH